MTRIHDMGGRFGDGPIPLKKIDGKVVDDEPVFKTDWHAKAFAITVASASVGKWSIDKSRFFRESLPPKDYAKFDYKIKELQNMGLADLKIIEDLSVQIENGSSVMETEDTMTLLDNYIDDIDLKVDKDNVKSIMRSLYMEASEL